MKLLVIRRDNIGDLLLTTPLLAALRAKLPNARIDLFTNSYAAPVLRGNPDVNDVHFYFKAHHRGEDRTRIGVFWDRARLLRQLRRTDYDAILLAKPKLEKRPLWLARMIGAREVVGIVEPGQVAPPSVTHVLEWTPAVGGHVVERCFQIARHFGIEDRPGPLRLFPDAAAVAKARERLAPAFGRGSPLVAVNLSARKLTQRWPATRFVELVRRLHERHGYAFMLVWSPGSESNPMHPGDDEKAAQVAAGLAGIPVVPLATAELHELVAGLSLASAMITADGGALHLGAAAGLPILALFGNSEVARWYPWGVPYEVLQPPSLTVEDISVADALAAWERLVERVRLRPAAA
jgi:ADP-heptose:LPS heptosyltransferase